MLKAGLPAGCGADMLQQAVSDALMAQVAPLLQTQQQPQRHRTSLGQSTHGVICPAACCLSSQQRCCRLHCHHSCSRRLLQIRRIQSAAFAIFAAQLRGLQ